MDDIKNREGGNSPSPLSFHITDRRLNPSGKNLNNRQRFIERVKDKIKNSVAKGLKDRGIGDQSNAEVSISRDGIEEPTFQYDRDSGIWDYMLPGNQDYMPGDNIPRPPSGGGGRGSEGSIDGEGEDEFRFGVSYDEYINAIFGDLELPDMVKESQKNVVQYVWRRAGFTPVGAASNLALEQTMIKGISRRIALKTPKYARIEELEELLKTEEDEDKRVAYLEEITELHTRANAIPFLDKTDLRFHNTVKHPLPVTQALMCCVDGETEYLSPTGWKKISSWNGDPVAQYTKEGTLEFVQATYVKNDHVGEFIRIKAQGIDQMLTPDHRVIYRDGGNNISEMTASELEERHNQTAFGFRGKFITHFKYIQGEGLSLSDDEIRFHVAWKADGAYQTEHGLRAQFIFHKKRKADRIIGILENLGWEYNYTKSDDNAVHRIYVTTPSRIERRFGHEWYHATELQMDIVSEEVLHWDGYEKRGNFVSQSKSDCDYIQFVWAGRNYGTNIHKSNDEWVTTRCSYAERTLTGSPPKKITREYSDDKHSYCFSVPSGMLILRRDDDIFVTGNCLMDVSGSMTEHMKDLAKRFYILLFLFLKRQYKNVDVVFIRHTHVATEVDEETFFHSTETGGTIVSTAYAEMERVIKARYPVDQWNIYCAQASDGDNSTSDNEICKQKLGYMLPWMQYLTYIEVGQSNFPSGFVRRDSDMWALMSEMVASHPNQVAMRRLENRAELIEVFRSLFKKRET